jgi:nucleoside-diphosphate-sugar epimerase
MGAGSTELRAKAMNMFIFGAGYSSLAFVKRVGVENHDFAGTTRDEDKIAQLQENGIVPYLFDGEVQNQQINTRLKDVTHLLISIAPPRDTIGNDVDPVLNVFGDTIKNAMPKLEWIGYLSTVGVYGNHDGAWVDETMPTSPVSARSIQRDIAEKSWIALSAEINIPLTIFRLAGIYGPNRNAFSTIEAGRSRRLVKKGQFFNRIHVADIAQAIELAAHTRCNEIFNITDNQPAPPQDVVTFAHKLMQREAPEEIDFETADLTPMARSFYGENKRVSNAKSKKLLGMDYAYPDYRTSLTKMWDTKDW